MPMTKAEKARVEELETALALHWPAYVAPPPMTEAEIRAAFEPIGSRSAVPSHGAREAARGWFYNAYNGHITRGWSAVTAHNRDNEFGDNASQNMGRMYRTRAEAAMAMRLEMSRDFAKKLAAVDRIIRGDD